ncbi:MAG: hypothetical protein OEL87_01290 [Nanoarchaeota archaeon]|nr:hypothetical protein [Nanoarchaeota archaeon]
MRFKEIVFFFSLIGILFLIFLTQSTGKIKSGKIKSVQASTNKITIKLEKFPSELIIFNPSYIILKRGDIIEFQGRQEVYKNKEQIIVDKIFVIEHR